MNPLPSQCPKCQSEDIYATGNLWICPVCSHEWTLELFPEDGNSDQEELAQECVIKDAHGVVLQNGDSVTVIKDLKVKGSSSAVKVGTRVKNISLVESSDGHNLSCKIEGFGSMYLKSEFVKKS